MIFAKFSLRGDLKRSRGDGSPISVGGGTAAIRCHDTPARAVSRGLWPTVRGEKHRDEPCAHMPVFIHACSLMHALDRQLAGGAVVLNHRQRRRPKLAGGIHPQSAAELRRRIQTQSEPLTCRRDPDPIGARSLQREPKPSRRPNLARGIQTQSAPKLCRRDPDRMVPQPRTTHPDPIGARTLQERPRPSRRPNLAAKT